MTGRIDRDLLIREALTPAPGVQSPQDLGDAIYRAVAQTPQRRATWAGSTRTLRVVWLVLLASLLVGGAILALSRIPPPPGRPGVVTMYHGGPARTGVMPGPGPVEPVEVGWRSDTGGPIPFSLMPVVGGNAVFVGDQLGALAALEVATGARIWTRSMDSPITASPALLDDLLIAGTEDGRLVALDASSGFEQWHVDAGSSVRASLAIVDGMVIAGTDGGDLLAVDAEGTVAWRISVGVPITRGPAVSDGALYLGTEGGRFFAFDLASRTELWRVELGPGGLATPAVANGLVYTATGVQDTAAPHALLALHPEDGSTAWTYTAPTGQGLFVSGVDSTQVYAGSEDFAIYAVNARSGAFSWRFQTTGTVGSLGTLSGGVLYIGSSDGNLYALDAATGVARWSIDAGGAPTIPVVIDGRVLIGTDLGAVTAIVGR